MPNNRGSSVRAARPATASDGTTRRRPANWVTAHETPLRPFAGTTAAIEGRCPITTLTRSPVTKVTVRTGTSPIGSRGGGAAGSVRTAIAAGDKPEEIDKLKRDGDGLGPACYRGPHG